MNSSDVIGRIVELAKQLIAIPSVTGTEVKALEFVESALQQRGWNAERWPIPGDARFNILASVSSSPKIIFTTHLDVVPAKPEQFIPRVDGNRLYGRGACDAKGIAAVMIEAADELRREGADDLALLFVADEERTSSGGMAAAPRLKERGIRYIVNGEPTEGKLVSAQKGAVAGMIRVEGKPCHSGYPHLGVDANAILVSIANALYRHNFGSDAELGTATVNIGKISGGVAPNIVSPMAELDFWVRTVGKASEVEKDVNKIIASSREKHLDAKIFLDVKSTSEPFHFHIVTGFPTVVVAYGSDAPYLGRSGARCLMFGPGSITLAHTDHEYVELAELASAFEDYKTLYAALSPAE